MNCLVGSLAVTAAGALLATDTSASDAKSLVLPVENEPPPALIVEAPLPGPLASSNLAFIPYRVENLRILPVGGPGAKNLSPRVGHLHIALDDLPWSWADYGQSDTIILINLPRGEHKLKIEVTDADGGVLTSQTVTFQSPGSK